MPILNFRKEFVEKIVEGEKRQTIRNYRKDGKNPKPGAPLYLYSGLATKNCRKLLKTECRCTIPIDIVDWHKVFLDGIQLDIEHIEKIALDDGFENMDDFYDYIDKTYELPFRGILIKW